MASTNPLIRDLFNTRDDLYLYPPKKDGPLEGSSSKPWLSHLFECGSIQTPNYGMRKIFVVEGYSIMDPIKRSEACSQILFSVVNLMRSHVKENPDALKAFQHPDQQTIWNAVYDDHQAMNYARKIKPNTDSYFVDKITGNTSFDRRAHTPLFFDVDSTYGFKQRVGKTQPEVGDELCCQIPITTGVANELYGGTHLNWAAGDVRSLRPNIGKVYISNVRGDACPELCSFVRTIKDLGGKLGDDTTFPIFTRTYQIPS